MGDGKRMQLRRGAVSGRGPAQTASAIHIQFFKKHPAQRFLADLVYTTGRAWKGRKAGD